MVPADVTLLEVEASSPGAALRKAARGHAEPVGVGAGLAVAMSRTWRQRNGDVLPIPGQLDLDGAEAQAA